MDPETTAERQKKQAQQRQEATEAKRHQDVLDKLDALGNENLRIMRAFVAYLNKHTSKVQVVNELKSIKTPDSAKVVAIIKELDKTVQGKEVNWGPMQKALKPVSDALERMASKKDPEAIEIPEMDYQQLADLFGAAIKKIAAPVVNYTAPAIIIPESPAPIINQEKVDLKPFVNEVLQVLTDFRVWTQDQIEEDPVVWSELRELMERQNELLAKIEKKKMGGGGGGGGGGYVFKAYGALGGMVAPELNALGQLPVAVDFQIIDNEVPSGTINGSNKNFATYYSYKPGTTKLYLNGQRLREGVGFDYIEAGGQTLTFSVAPATNDILLVDYTKL